ncbi:MAG TPA: hypothetical protein P5295_18965, partial [Spirochaetota bacterium]|nr:hypothetical protein [Spirochaetota bacterium]
RLEVSSIMKKYLKKSALYLLLVLFAVSMQGCDNTGETGSGSADGQGNRTVLDTPENLSATDGTYTDRIVITWAAVANAAGYTLYRSETADGNYAIVADVDAAANPSYVDLNTGKNTHFYYKTRANSSNSNIQESKLSAYDDGYARNGAATVEDLTATDGIHDATIGLTWALVDGATSYRIYRSGTLDGNYEQIATIDPPSSEDPVDPEDPEDPVDPTDPSATSLFTSDIDLSGGITVKYLYTYRIRIRVGAEIDETVEFKNFSLLYLFGKKFDREDVIEKINDAAGFELASAYDSGDAQYVNLAYGGEPIILVNDTSNAPIAKFLKTGVAEDQVVIVNGDGVSVIGETDYTDNPSDYITGDTGGGDDNGGDSGDDSGDTEPAYYYVDSDVTRDIYYYYKVQAVDASGPGDLSDFDFGFCGLAPAPAAPVNVSASDGTSPDSITISWNPGIGAETYTVYRARWQKSSIDGGYVIEPGTFTQIATGLTGETYTDESTSGNTIEPGQYYYSVVSEGSTGTSERSACDSGYRTITDEEFVEVYRQTEDRLMEKIKDEFGSTPIGSATFYGDIDGNVAYSSTFSGSTGKVSVPYSDYCEFYAVINGTTSTTINIWSLPGSTTGTITFTGIYPGTIELHLEVNTGGSCGGYYMVTRQGGSQSRVEWTE